MLTWNFFRVHIKKMKYSAQRKWKVLYAKNLTHREQALKATLHRTYHGIVELLFCSSRQPHRIDRCRRRKSDVASFSPYFCPLSDFRRLLVRYFNSVLDESWSNILHCVWIALSTITFTFKERHGHEEKHVNTMGEGGLL